MNTSHLTVAVIIPTYNGAKFIEETIRSVWQQTRLPDELIISDDCSSDDTLAIIEQLSPLSPIPIQVIRHETNSGGPARPMNDGIRLANSVLIAVLDQDDVFLPHHNEIMANIFESRPSVTLVKGWGGIYPEATSLLPPPATRRDMEAAGRSDGMGRLIDGADLLRILITRGGIETGFPGFMFRRTDWEQNGGMDESLRILADLDIQCRLSRSGQVAVIPHPVYLRRDHGNNLSWNAAFQGYFDLARLMVRYSTAAGAQDEWLYRRMSQQYIQLHLALGWAKRHREAYRRLFASGRNWGWSAEHLMTFARISYTWFARYVLGKQFIVPFDKVDQFRQALDELRQICDKGLAEGDSA